MVLKGFIFNNISNRNEGVLYLLQKLNDFSFLNNANLQFYKNLI